MKYFKQLKAQKGACVRRLLSFCLTFCFLVCFQVPGAAEGNGDLASLSVSGVSVIRFDPSQTEYTVYLPQRYADGEATVPAVPKVYAAAADRTANVQIDYPESVADRTITVTVTPADGTPKVYTLALEVIGENLYSDYSFENESSGTNSYFASGTENSPMGIRDDVAYSGTKSVRRPSSSDYLRHSPEIMLEAGKTYLSSYATRTMNDASYPIYDCVESLTDGQRATVSYYENGTYLATKQTNDRSDTLVKVPTNLTSIWKELQAVITTQSTYNMMHFCVDEMWRNWGESRMDDMFLGEVVVADGEVTDADGSAIGILTKPEEGTERISLGARFYNQLGTAAGMENVAPTHWELAEAYSGVSLDDSGILTYTAEAPKNVTVRGFANAGLHAQQTEVKCEAVLTFADSSDFASAELKEIQIDGYSVPDFRPTRTNYSMYLPYRYHPQKQTITGMPTVTATPVQTGTTYTVSYPSDLNGGTIAVTSVAENGAMKVYNIGMHVVGENFYVNSGFEDDGIPYSKIGGSAEKITDNPGDGTYSLEIGFFGNINGYEPRASLEAGKTYLSSRMLRKTSKTVDDPNVTTDDIQYRLDKFAGNSVVYFAGRQIAGSGFSYLIHPADEWNVLEAVLMPSANWSDQQMYNTEDWATWNYMALDNGFLGELTVADIVYSGSNQAVIPENGEARYPLSASLYNQMGTQVGLENETVQWEVLSSDEGVTTENNQLVVGDTAREQAVQIRATVQPSFGSGYKIAKSFTILLRSESAEADIPKALHVGIDGTVEVGSALTGIYTYRNIKNIAEGASTYEWLYADTKNGAKKLIEGETTQNFTVTEAYVDKYIFFRVTPCSVEGKRGAAVTSGAVLHPVAPQATAVSVTGGGYVGSSVTGVYEFADPNGDAENGTTYRWLRSPSKTGPFAEISGAISLTYTVTEEDIDQYICFEVTPGSSAEPKTGQPVRSAPMMFAAYPTVKDVTIHKVSNTSYRVSYTYAHPLGVEEGVCRIRWHVDGGSGGNEMSQTVSQSCKSVSVSITPVAVKAPLEGNTVTKSMSISSNSTVVGRGSGGGGGGGGSKLVPVPEKTPAPTAAPEPVRHWAADGIDFVKSRGIMQEPTEGDFCNGRLVSRCEFVYYVMKTLGYKETAYIHEFNDVSGDDYYAGLLQTAVNEGIISKDVSFYPERDVSREEMSKIMILASKLQAEETVNSEQFADSGSISEWARSYVAKAVESGLLKGVSETEFMPMGRVTREQTAVLLKRLFDYQNGGAVS